MRAAERSVLPSPRPTMMDADRTTVVVGRALRAVYVSGDLPMPADMQGLLDRLN